MGVQTVKCLRICAAVSKSSVYSLYTRPTSPGSSGPLCIIFPLGHYLGPDIEHVHCSRFPEQNSNIANTIVIRQMTPKMRPKRTPIAHIRIPSSPPGTDGCAFSHHNLEERPKGAIALLGQRLARTDLLAILINSRFAMSKND
jgi:hypothetical protein